MAQIYVRIIYNDDDFSTMNNVTQTLFTKGVNISIFPFISVNDKNPKISVFGGEQVLYQKRSSYNMTTEYLVDAGKRLPVWSTI